jgi:hypothetical protein
LPAEIIMQIVSQLEADDIAKLRLASRAFTHLPMSLWHQLIVKDMPWLYEAWSSDPIPYKWATVVARNKSIAKVEKERATAHGGSHGSYEQMLKDGADLEYPDNAERQELLESMPIKLDYHKTNWYQLYRDIVANWDEMKGLQNRRRVWEECVMPILDAIRDRPGKDADIEDA